MAELKWEDGRLCMCAASNRKSHRSKPYLWRIESNGGMISIGNSSCDLLDAMLPDKDGDKLFKYLNISKAKAACQSAEDKLCDVWPKYVLPSGTEERDDIAYYQADSAGASTVRVYKDGTRAGHSYASMEQLIHTHRACEPISKADALSRLDENKWPKYTNNGGGFLKHGGAVYTQWESPVRCRDVCKDGHTSGWRTHTGWTFSDTLLTQISETIALSRLEKPMYEGKKLVLKIAQPCGKDGKPGNVLVGWVYHQDESLRSKKGDRVLYLANVDDFKTKSAYRPRLNCNNIHVRGEQSVHDNKLFCYAYDTVDEATEAVKEIQACVTIINAESEQAAVEPSKSIEFKTIC